MSGAVQLLVSTRWRLTDGRSFETPDLLPGDLDLLEGCGHRGIKRIRCRYHLRSKCSHSMWQSPNGWLRACHIRMHLYFQICTLTNQKEDCRQLLGDGAGCVVDRAVSRFCLNFRKQVHCFYYDGFSCFGHFALAIGFQYVVGWSGEQELSSHSLQQRNDFLEAIQGFFGVFGDFAKCGRCRNSCFTPRGFELLICSKQLPSQPIKSSASYASRQYVTQKTLISVEPELKASEFNLVRCHAPDLRAFAKRRCNVARDRNRDAAAYDHRKERDGEAIILLHAFPLSRLLATVATMTRAHA